MEHRRIDGYGISPYVSRTPQGDVAIPEGYPRPVKIHAFNTEMDYAIVELCDDISDLKPIPLSFENIESDMDLKVYHCPVDSFNELHVEDLSHFTEWVKTALPTGHHVSCNKGLYSGSSGGPLITRGGRVVAMHVESISAAKEIDKADMQDLGLAAAIELISETVNSHAHIHASFSRALVLGKCRVLRAKLIELGVHS
jgi:hypothetical protein